MPTNHGLTDAQLNIIKTILAPFAEDIERVLLFGSRASGTYKSYSDIDIALDGPIKEEAVDRLYSLFMESGLPFRVDLVSYRGVQSSPLKRHIDWGGVILFGKDELMGMCVME